MDQLEAFVSQIVKEVLAANAAYAQAFGDKGRLALPPTRRFAILTCMDARLHPSKYAGLSEGDAHVIRNAGGRASDDAIRSLVISYKLLGTREWFVIHHSDCGMELFTDDLISGLLEKSLETAEVDDTGWHLDCAANPISSVPDRLDCVARFALPLRAPAPEYSHLGMHLSHPRAGSGRHDRPAGEDPPPTNSVRH
jgi:carbonic anhydrase